MPSKLLHKRINLDRFKKTAQGLIEFAVLIEQAETKNAETIIAQATAEDPDFIFLAMRKVVFFDELVHLEESILAEVLSKCSSKLLAFALHESTEEFRHHVLRHLSLTGRKDVLEEEEKKGNRIGKQFIVGAQKHILRIGRELEAKGVFSFEVPDCPRLHSKKKRA